MADEIYQPHDKLFRAVFSDAREAADLLQASLPDTLRNRFDWTTLTLVDGTFLDDDLRESQSDLLYRVKLANTGSRCRCTCFSSTSRRRIAGCVSGS